MAASIRNCVFAYKCTRSWDSLQVTSERDMRFCDDCQREVHYCHDAWSLGQAIALNRCVAVVVEDIRSRGAGLLVLGEPAAHYQGNDPARET